ncbi:MAG: ABC transporter ATP-binding protein [Fuerstia sp.]|nr:ABC transporter ATP-binding protein [Fuerstiella sp.]
MISISQLTFTYGDGTFRLRIPQLTLESGRSAVIVGPSGSGKTTLLNLIAGILPGSGGEIRVGNTDVHRLNDNERRLFRLQNVGQVFQDFQLIDYLNVLDNVLLPCRIHPSVTVTKTLRERASLLLHSVEMSNFARRSVTRLSQGERQRVAICRALLLSPRVVLADEPTGNLDPVNAERIVRLLRTETVRSGATLIMVTHDHSLLPQFDQIIPFDQFVERTTDERSNHEATEGDT